MEDSELDSIGFMFDACHSKVTKTFLFSRDIVVNLQLIGEDPGHVQSGQYLWPAASFAANHMIERWDVIGAAEVLELGAGCGLAGIVAGNLPGTRVVVLTDYDHGSLSLLADNTKGNCRGNPDVEFIISFLKWGLDLESLPGRPPSGFGLIIGTDLLYCEEIVPPLLRTVAELLNKETGLFILVSSFCVGEVLPLQSHTTLNIPSNQLSFQKINQIFEEMLLANHLISAEFESLDTSTGRCRVQYIRLHSP